MARVYRFTVEGFTPLGDLWEMNLHYQTDVPVAGTEPTIDYILTQLAQHYSTSGENLLKLANTISTGCGITRLRIYQRVAYWEGEIPESQVRDYSVTGTLTAGTDVPPQPVCPWFKLQTALAGKSFRGGTHGGPVPSASYFDGAGRFDTTGTYWTNLEVLRAAIGDHLNDNFQTTGDINLVVYSETRHRRGQDHVNKVTTVSKLREARWLRRRMEGRGA